MDLLETVLKLSCITQRILFHVIIVFMLGSGIFVPLMKRRSVYANWTMELKVHFTLEIFLFSFISGKLFELAGHLWSL